MDHVRVHECDIKCIKGDNFIRFYAGTPGIVLDKIIIAANEAAIKESYFGPSENA